MTDYDVPRVEFSTHPITLDEARFRHSGWRHQRRTIFEALKRLHVSNNRLDRFSNCGGGCYVQVSPSTEKMRISGSFCHDRLCQACGTARAQKIATALARQLPVGPVRFVTLTLRHSATPLRDQLDRLYRSFQVLRRRTAWANCIDGGAAFLECKLSDRDGLWHVHLHVLVSGRYLPQKTLSEAWHAVTGDSSIVDIRSVPDRAGAASYVAKYAAKPLDAAVYQHQACLDEFILAIKHRRLCWTFGKWRGIDLDDTGDDPGDWRTIGSLASLFADCRAGDADAQAILASLLNHDLCPFAGVPPDLEDLRHDPI